MIKIVNGDLPNDALEAAMRVKTIGVDTETSRLDMVNGKLNLYSGKLATVQVFVPNFGTVIIRNLDEWPTRLGKLLEYEGTTKIFHFASFDLHFLMREFPFIFPVAIADTKVAATFFDPNKTYFVDGAGKGSHSLKVLVKKVFGYDMNKDIAVSNWLASDLSSEQLEYAAKDVEFLPDLLTFLELGIMRKDPGLIASLLESYRYLPTKVMIDIKLGNGNVFAYQ